jgi:hypothetical protein
MDYALDKGEFFSSKKYTRSINNRREKEKEEEQKVKKMMGKKFHD